MKVYLVCEYDMGDNITDIVAVFGDYASAEAYCKNIDWYGILEKEVKVA